MIIMIDPFQFPLHRDPRCNWHGWYRVQGRPPFQFPLHRDPRCNPYRRPNMNAASRFSSLYIGILAATQPITDAITSNLGFSSLYIGILAATLLCLVNAPPL